MPSFHTSYCASYIVMIWHRKLPSTLSCDGLRVESSGSKIDTTYVDQLNLIQIERVCGVLRRIGNILAIKRRNFNTDKFKQIK